MEKKINISGKDITFKATGATPRVYRRLFGRDIFADIQAMTQTIASNDGLLTGDAVELFENLVYAMAYHADPEIGAIEDWLDELDMFAVIQKLPEIMALWNLNMVQIEEPKKKAGKQSDN